MKKFSRATSFLLALAIILSMAPTWIFATEVSDGNEYDQLSDAWPTVNTDLTHIVCYGQSFSTGSDAPYYADETVDGVYVYGHITNSTSGTELVAISADTAGNQHPVISAGNSLAQMLTEAGYDTDLVLGSYGAGGRTIAQLMSDERQAEIKEEEGYEYDINSSGRYAVFQSSVAALAEYAEGNEQSISCPVIVYLQGETDQNTDAEMGYPDNPIRAGYGAGGDKEKYKEYMSRLKEDMQREVMEAYGQTEKPLFIIYQVSGTYTRTQYSSINMAQLEFAQENDDVILVQTPYFTSHYTNSHHLTQNGYRWLGEYIAKYAYTALVEGEKSWPLLPERIEVVDEYTVSITVGGAENGLTIDTWTVEDATNSGNLYGFYLVADGTNFVPTDVTVFGNEITLTLPAQLTAETVHVYYAGKNAKGTGNIRDNCSDVGYYEYLDDSSDTGTGDNQGVSHSSLDAEGNSIIGQKYPMYNWLASFCYEVEVPEAARKPGACYRWEIGESGLVSVTEENYAENALTLQSGSVEDGVLSGVRYSMSETVVLDHDRPWAIEWKAAGNDSSYGGGMLLTTSVSSSCAQYLYLPADSRGLVAWGVGSDSANYGFKLTDHSIDTRTEHIYRIENRIAEDGTNTIYLLVDGVEIGAMTTGYRTSADASGAAGSMIEEPNNWANGKDIYVDGIGGSGSFLLNNLKLSYLQIEECCHTFENGVCTVCGAERPEPEWEIGTIAYATGQNRGDTNRLRTADYLKLTDYSAVAVDKGYMLVRFVYDEDYNYLNGTSWLGDGIGFSVEALREEYPEAVYFRVALCANDGRDLSLDDLDDSNVTFYLSGEEVPEPNYGFVYEDVGSIGSWQDGAIWDGKLFVLGASGTGAVYEVETAKKLGSLTLGKKDVIVPHANSVCFGSTYYADGDKYPLLYVNIYNNYASAEDRMEGTCCVYRIMETDGVFSTELVQVIEVGFTEDLTLWKSKEDNGDVRPYGNFVVDTDENKLYAFVMRDADKTTRFFGFDIPGLEDGTYNESYGCNVVTLEQADILTQFDTEYFNYLQGCCYSSGKIVSVEGFGGTSPLRIVDLETKTVEGTFYLGYAGLTKEPEVVCVDHVTGVLYYATADGVLRVITLDDVHFHSYETTVTAPTCTEQGYTTYTCECGDSYVADYMDATGHTEVIDSKILPTSAKSGLTEGSHCAVCGEVLTAQETVPAKGYEWMVEDGEFKLLLIGNSYSEDASSCGFGMTESQLLDILQAMLGEDVKITVGLACSGGKGLNWHATQADQGNASHSLRVIESGGNWSSKGSMVLCDALDWTDWDVVTLQHYNINTSTGEESVPYPDTTDEKFYKMEVAAEYLLDYVNDYAPQADAYFYTHWAQTSSITLNAALSNYKKMGVYMPVVLDYVGTESGKTFAGLIPVGLSIQNARTTYLALLAYNTTAYADKNLNLYTDAQIGLQRDGGHVSFNIGRYIAGLTFAETIIPEEIRTEMYTLPSIRVTESVGELPAEYTEIAQKAVFAALNGWKNGKLDEVTTIEGYEEDPAVAAGETLSSLTLDVSCAGDDDAVSSAVLAVLPADFAVDSVEIPEEYNDTFTAAVTIRFGYTSLTVDVACKVAEHSYEAVVTAPTSTERGYTTHTCTRCGDSYVDTLVAPIIPERISYIGNSLLQGSGYGMCASASDKDYYYLVNAYIESIRGEAPTTTGRIRGNYYERATTLEEATEKIAAITASLSGDEDCIMIQLGDNVGSATIEVFRESCEMLIRAVQERSPVAKIYWVGMWYGNADKYAIIEEACSNTGIQFISLKDIAGKQNHNSYLGAIQIKPSGKYSCSGVTEVMEIEPETSEYRITVTFEVSDVSYQATINCDSYALDDSTGVLTYQGTEYIVCDKGVASHPGDEGFRKIANRILFETGMCESEEYYKCPHTYTSAVTVPTCTGQGYTTYTCSTCGDSYVADYVEATGHDMDDWTVTKAANCTETGEKRRDCSRCDYFETETISATGHTEVSNPAVAPTCTETGLTEGKHCSVCNEVLVAQTVVDALGHTEIIDKAVTPTCTETGLTEGKHCSVCNEVLAAQTVVDALGHTEVIDKTVAPTCTDTGLTEGKHCSVCDEVLVAQTVVDALGHTEIIDKAVAPTCTETGLTEGKHCSVCNEILVAQTMVGALGHDFEYTDSEGLKTGCCTRCGAENVQIGTPSWRIEDGKIVGTEYTNGKVLIALYGENGRLIAVKFCARAEVVTVGGVAVYRFTAPEFTEEEIANARKIFCFNMTEQWTPLREVHKVR